MFIINKIINYIYYVSYYFIFFIILLIFSLSLSKGQYLSDNVDAIAFHYFIILSSFL